MGQPNAEQLGVDALLHNQTGVGVLQVTEPDIVEAEPPGKPTESQSQISRPTYILWIDKTTHYVHLRPVNVSRAGCWKGGSGLTEGTDRDAWERRIHARFAGGSVWVRNGGRHYHVTASCERINPGCLEVTLNLDQRGYPDMLNKNGLGYSPCPSCAWITLPED
jgi:hypothetical protein